MSQIAGPIHIGWDDNEQPIYTPADSVYDLSSDSFIPYGEKHTKNKGAAIAQLPTIGRGNIGYAMAEIPNMVWYNENRDDPGWELRPGFMDRATDLYDTYKMYGGNNTFGRQGTLSTGNAGNELRRMYQHMAAQGARQRGGLSQAGMLKAMGDARYGQEDRRALNYTLGEVFGYKGPFGGRDPNADSFQKHIDRTGQRGALQHFMSTYKPNEFEQFTKSYQNLGGAGMGDHAGPQNAPDFGDIGIEQAISQMIHGYEDDEGKPMGGFKQLGPVFSSLSFPAMIGGTVGAALGKDFDVWGGGGWGAGGYNASQAFGNEPPQSPHSPDGGPGLGYGD